MPKKPKSDTLSIVKSESTIIPDEVIDPEKLSELDVRETVYDGTLTLQYLLFNHAKNQKPKLNRLRNIIENVESQLYSENTIQALEKSQLIKLYAMANERETESIAFLERLHKTVQETENVSKVTRALSENSGNVIDVLKYKNKNVDGERLRNVKDLLIKNILGNQEE
jgi:hypothetical protein